MPHLLDENLLRSRIAEILPEIVDLRRDLHRNPELMYAEHRTSGKVRQALDDFGIEHRSGYAGGTGIVAHIPATGSGPASPADPSERAGRSIGLRADMDALPIHEATGLPYASAHEGVMHACGHDGHTAMLVAVAKVLAAWTERPNPVTLIFQPAEEGGRGAERMVAEGALAGAAGGGIGPGVDRVFGLHGWPGLAAGSVSTREGPLMGAAAMFDATVIGHGGHAAEPDRTRDPVLAAAQAVVALQSVIARSTDPGQPGVLSVTSIDAGSAVNVIPDRVALRGTARAASDEQLRTIVGHARRVLTGVVAALGCRAEIDVTFACPATVNDPLATHMFLEIARGALGGDRVAIEPSPTLVGEDFAFYGADTDARACFYFLGLCPPGEDPESSPRLHEPEFDFNDAALPVGIELMCRLALQAEPVSAPSGGGQRA